MLKNNVLIFADHVVFPKGEVREGPFYVVVKNGKISKISKAESSQSSVAHCDRCDAVTCHLLAPGFVDIHNHGLDGEDVLNSWKEPELTCAKAVTSGTTSLLASIPFPQGRQEETRTMLKNIQNKVGVKSIGAVIEGIHAEGPLISDIGGLSKYSPQLSENEFGNLLDEMPGLKMMTISPHIASQSDYDPIKMLIDRNVVASLGHDCQADELEILEALSVNREQQCHITHLYNNMKFNHRNPGLANFALLDSYPMEARYAEAIPPTIEIIGDMIHVHPLAVKLALSSRSLNEITFVTDCVTKETKAITQNVESIQMEKSDIKGCDTSVESCCTMLEIFTSLTKTLDVPLGKACMMLSENPARIAKLDNIGTIEVGKDANFIMFDQNYKHTKTFVDGRMAFRASTSNKKSIVLMESQGPPLHVTQ